MERKLHIETLEEAFWAYTYSYKGSTCKVRAFDKIENLMQTFKQAVFVYKHSANCSKLETLAFKKIEECLKV